MSTLARTNLFHLTLRPNALRRALLAGSAWGIATSAGLAALHFWQCGLVCPDDIALTTVLSVGAGLLTFGPLAAFAPPRSRD
jgi:hypothetical protein